MSQTVNFKWPQGEDLEIALIYKEGGSEYSASAVNLSSGYEVRMDVVLPATKAVLYTVQSDGDNSTAVSLGTGAYDAPNLVFWLPRAWTLDGGALYTNLATTTNFNYDIFLRNTATDKQIKVMRGQLQVERSNTQWL